MGKPTAEQIGERAFDLGLLNERQLRQVWASFGSRNVRVSDFLQTLVRRELMTNYQVERLVKGERSGFFFGDYKVLYLVGAGTFARVYRAVHQQTRQVVAVKVLRNRYSENAVQYGQFVREGKVGCTLRHENIVPVYEVYSQGRTHFLVMEFVEGRNLGEFVKIRKKLDPEEAVRLMIDINRGLQYAFENGLTHRDLKMNNVLVSSSGQAKLVDFGLAAMDETLTETDLADLPNARTIDYAALERATGVRKDDTRSDIYFLGCIFYHMLTGKPPLSETRDRLMRLSKQRFLEVTPIRKADPKIPDSVALVVNKSMMLDPKHRYQSPGEMMGDLQIAAKRLAEGDQSSGAGVESGTAAGGRPQAGPPEAPPTPKHTVMIVESNVKMQDILRDGFRRAGYRVLLTSDPSRAFERFCRDATVADCVLFNAQELGQGALEMFNQFGDEKRTEFIPAILMLDENQRQWKEEAKPADNRAVVLMPITMKKLRAAVAKLVSSGEPAQ